MTETRSMSLTLGVIGVIFVLNGIILGYAIHVSRPAAHVEERRVDAPPVTQTTPVVTASVAAASSPIIPGLHNRHPLSARLEGELLLGELQCAACHEGATAWSGKQAPDLADVGARVDPEYLRRFIASPSATHHGTTMPDLLAAEAPERRAEIAEAITQFLVSRSSGVFRRTAADADEAGTGHGLYHTLGCVACHSPRDDAGREIEPAGVVSLVHVADKYGLESLTEFLFQPNLVRHSGRMPDMSLSRGEARAIAAYLIGPEEADGEPPTVPTALAGKGQVHFIQLRCNACHALDGLPEAVPAPALADLDPQRGCLSEAPGAAPHFHLDGGQRAAIREALAASPLEPADDTGVEMTMTAFNCIACHARDDYGGVAFARDPFFTTTEPSLGNEARIPPTLTLLGAKLRSEWLHRVLFDAESVRPYMLTRMPQYGEANLKHLPPALARLDSVDPVEMPLPEGETEKAYRQAGRELMGDTGLNCINCHDFNGKPSPGFNGMDLMTTYDRLEPSWLYHFMRSPGTLRPGITMPNYWAGGEARRDDILDGDPDAQIRAIWHYMSLGTSAADPPGIRAEPTRLVVTDTARLYRGRSNVAGFRGIAVGFPGGLNYAFDAQNGALSALWRGDYVTVNWHGQAPGNFNPASRPVRLAQDLAFHRLDSDDDPWPLRPVTTKENPINPDPRYPRQHGYQFKGYSFDDESIPTLMYRSGDVDIEDRSIRVEEGDQVMLARTIRFSSPTEQTLWFRVLTGAIEPASEGRYSTPDLVLTIPQTPATLRGFGDGDERELLLRLAVPKGESEVTLLYELLR